MPKRSLLRKQIIDAWRETIREKYNRRLINSERGLQIYFCHELMKMFGERKRRVFIEPCVKFEGVSRYPDLLICNSKRIIGIIEIKYLPRGRPKHEKDIETLKFFADHPEGLEVANDRYRGTFK